MRPTTLRPRILARRPLPRTLRIETLEPREVPAGLDLTNNVLTFTAGGGVNNNLSVALSGGNLVVTDTGETITTSISGASGSGTNSVSVPASGVTGVTLNLEDGADAIASAGVVVAGQALTINHAGTSLTIAGPISTTSGSLSIVNTGTGGITDLTTAVTAATFVANTVTNATWASNVATITTSAAHGLAVGQSVTVANITPSGYNGTFTITSIPTSTTFTYALTTNPGAYTSGGTAGGIVSATTAAAHNLVAGQTVSIGGVAPAAYNGTFVVLSVPTSTTFTYSLGASAAALTAAGTESPAIISSTTGPISITSSNALALAASVGTGGTLALRANEDGAGSEGLSQTAGTITTTNTSVGAATIEANTAAGGTGNVSIDSASVGSNSGGTLTVLSHGGSILYPGTAALTSAQQGTANGGSAPARVLSAHDYVFTATGAGSIGTSARPIQTTNLGADGVSGGSNFTLSAGDGGAFLTDWGTVDGTLAGDSVTGPGAIRFVTANASGHNMFVTGNVSAASGNIFLAADDNFVVGPGVTIGGAGFSGTVWMQANRDQATAGQPLTMNSSSSIVTSNTTNVPNGTRTPTTQAVYLDISGDQGTPSAVTLGSIAAGNGGRIVVNAIPNGIAAEAGSIAMAGPGNVLDAGPTGTIALTAGITDTGTTAANAVGTAAVPIKVAGGNVVVSSNDGNVNISGTAATSVTATLTATVSGQTAAPSVGLSTLAGALTIPAALANVDGGSVTLSGAGGVVLGAQVGGSSSGTITVNGPLSGSGNIALGSGGVSLAQDANSTYDGVISGNQAVVKAGGGTLTLSQAQTYTGATTVSAGTLNLGGNLTGTSGVTVAAGGTLANTNGSATVPIAVSGTLAPGGSGVALINTGNLSFAPGGVLAVNLNGSATPGTDYDQVAVTGSADATGATLRILVGATPTLSVGQTFTILANDGTDPTGGQFANGSTITAADNPQYRFSVATNGGDGNDIVLTLATILPPRLLDVTGGTVSYQTGANIDSSVSVGLSGGNYTLTDTSGSISLSAAAIAAGWTGDGTSSVTGPTAGVTAINFDLSDGSDTINGLTGGSADVTVKAGSSLVTAGDLTTTGSLTFANVPTLALGGTVDPTGSVTTTGIGSLSLTGTVSPGGTASLSAVDISAAASSLVSAPTVILTAGDAVGTSGSRVNTQANTLNVSAGSGGAYLAETGGANLTATATGTGTIDVTNAAGALNLTASTAAGNLVVVNSSGTLTIAGATSTTSGNISLSSGDDVVLAADLTAGAGTITIAANTDGAGSQGVSQTAGTITTGNTGTAAATITANTAAGGTGDISIDNASIGSTVGGTLTVTSNAGSILYSGSGALDAFQQGIQGNGGTEPARVLKAGKYVFTATGDGSIGMDARPMQSDDLVATDSAVFSAGTGGVYWTDWGSTAFSLSGATATGAGNIRVVTANAGGHNLNVTGPVTTGSGSIFLAADDDFALTGPIGGAGFSGTVYLAGNRDTGNTLNLKMNGRASITTSNNTANAVFLEGFNTNGTRAGGIVLNSITVGDGGTITATTGSVATGQGTITAFNSSVALNAGPTGHVVLTAPPQVSATNSIGTPSQPIQVTAGTVVATSNATTSTTGNTSGIYVTATGPASFTADIGGPNANAGNISLSTASGLLTLAGATSTVSNGTITLTGAGGVAINAPLGGPATGNMTINAGSNPAMLNTTLNLSSTQTLAVTAANGLVVSSTGTVTGTGAASNATPLTVQAGGLVSPAGTGVGTLNVGNTALGANSTLRMDLNNSSSGDALNVNGSLDVTGAILDLEVNGTLNVGDAFTILSNDGSDGVTGQFVGGTTISAGNNPRYVFTLNYAGGDGNDVVATLSDVITTSVVDTTPAGRVTFASADGLSNNVSVARAGSGSSATYSITDPAGAITLSQAATAAGWTGSGTNTVTGPVTGVAGLQLALGDGTDTLNGVDFGSVPLTVTGSGSLTIAGTVTGTGPVTVNGVTDIAGTGSIGGTTLTLTASNGIGTSSQPLATVGTALVLAAGNGGINVAEADGADLTATATASGNIAVTNAVGTLNVAGPTSTVNGDISLASADAVTLGADVNAGSGTITIAANTDGVGGEGYDQKGASLITTNATPTAVSIAVNTASGGTGDAVIGQGSIGTNTGGAFTVNSRGGNILWSNDPTYAAFTTSQTGLASGGSNTQTLKAYQYNLTTTAAGGSIGTDARPLQFDNFGANELPNTDANLIASAGTGGVFVTDWGVAGNDLTTGAISAQGAGNIRIVTANSGGHNMWVAGPVTSGSGTISLYADDELTITGTGLVGGAGFSGLVDLIANRDAGNGQSLNMQDGSAIVTSNNSANAISLVALSGGNNASTGLSDLTPQGGVVLTNVTAGDGGTITVSAAGGTGAARQGTIVQRANTLVDAGPNGTVVLLARANDTTATTNPLNAGNIGANGDINNLVLFPVTVRAGTVTIATNGTNLGNTGVVDVIDTIGGTFTATTTGSATAAMTLATQAGALTIGGATSTAGGPLSLTGPGGVVLNAAIGVGSSGAITVAGPLGGTGNIAFGSGGLTVTQDTDSTYGGAISGSGAVAKTGAGALTLAGASTYAGGTIVSAGALLAGNSTGSATGSGPVMVADGATLGGSGAIAGAVTVSGTLAPGTGHGSGLLATGPISFGPSGARVLAVDLNGSAAGTGYDQLAVTGSIDLTGATLTPTADAGFHPLLGTTLTLLANDGTDAINRTFSGLADGITVDIGSRTYKVSYTGGDGNDLILTVTHITSGPPTNIVPGDQTGLEDTDLVFSAATGNALSTDDPVFGGPLEVELTATNGVLTLSGTTGLTFSVGDGTTDADMKFVGAIADIQAALDGLRYTPEANYNGPATITISTDDMGGTGNAAQSDADTVNLTVTPVNDPPTFTKGPDQTLLEDAGPQSIAGWATNMSSGPPDESGQTLTFHLSADNPTMFSALPAIDPATGTLTFTPAPDANGTATITVTLQDSGGTANGGQDTSAAQTFLIDITPVNDAPTFTKGADPTVPEDSGPQSITDWATGISAGPANEASQTLAFHVSVDNTALFSVQPAIDPTTGTLTFTSAPNANGSATVTVALTDDGGTANGGVDATGPQTFTITVPPVNDPPTLDPIGNITINEDDPEQTVSFTGITAGPADEFGQHLTVTATSSDHTVFADPAVQYAGGTSGTLKFTPLPNANATVTVTVTVTDDGGTANGGVNSFSQTFTVTVNAVDDAPTTSGIADKTVGEDSGSQSVPLDPSFSDVDDPNSALSLTITGNSNPSLFSTITIDPATHDLQFTPAVNTHGSSSLTVRATDPSGLFVETSFTVTVTPVNHAPSMTPVTSFSLDEDDPEQVVSLTGISAGPADEAGQTITITATSSDHTVLADPTVTYAGGSTGSLRFTPLPNANGTVTVTVTLHDDGGTANGGVDTATFTFQVTVNPEPDRPVIDTSFTPLLPTIKLPIKKGTFPAGAPISILTAHVSDPDVGDPKGVAITGVDTAAGTWQYTLDGGTTWTNVPAVSDTNALLLVDNPNTELRLLPGTKFRNRYADVTYRAWDQTNGKTPGTLDNASHPNSTTYSAQIEKAWIAVGKPKPVVNAAGQPNLTPVRPLLEDHTSAAFTVKGFLTFLGLEAKEAEPTVKAFGIALSDVTGGIWQFNTGRGGWRPVPAVSDGAALLLRPTDRLLLVPTPNSNGVATITYHTWDQTTRAFGTTADTAGAGFSPDTETAVLTIAPVNDAPVLDTTQHPSLGSIAAGQTTTAVAVSAFLGGVATDVDSPAIGIQLLPAPTRIGVWQFSPDGGTTWQTVKRATELAPDALIRFLASATAKAGTYSLAFRAWDQSGKAGTALSKALGTATLTVS